jgi:hypothetical protein
MKVRAEWAPDSRNTDDGRLLTGCTNKKKETPSTGRTQQLGRGEEEDGDSNIQPDDLTVRVEPSSAGNHTLHFEMTHNSFKSKVEGPGSNGFFMLFKVPSEAQGEELETGEHAVSKFVLRQKGVATTERPKGQRLISGRASRGTRK